MASLDSDRIPDHVFAQRHISRERFVEIRAEMAERERRAPARWWFSCFTQTSAPSSSSSPG